MEGDATASPEVITKVGGDAGRVDSDVGVEYGDTVSSVAHFSLIIFVVATVLNLVERVVRSIKVPDIRRQVTSLQQDVASLRAQALKLVSPYVMRHLI